MSNSQEQEALARQLCALYVEAQGIKNLSQWEDLDPVTRESWIQVAQFVETMIGNTIAVYGYNGNEKYVGLDTLIEPPDHR